jgi:hypothetical protein
VSAPKQHISREDNETIREGETPEDWKSKPAKNRQKDKDARWDEEACTFIFRLRKLAEIVEAEVSGKHLSAAE